MPRLGFIIFITVFSAILFVANWVVYAALVDIFNFNYTVELWILGIVMGVLSASFIASSIIGSYYYNWFTRAYYRMSAIWIGCFVYLFMASVIYSLLVMFSVGYIGAIGALLMLSALILNVYAVLHAKNIRIKDVDVELPHLPDAWRGRKAVWTSDVHLGQLHGPSFSERVVQIINSIPHDIVFIGGDLFDGTGAPDIHELVEPFKNVRAPLGTYFVTGNHEEFGDSNRFTAAVTAHGMKVLDDALVEIDGLQLVGVDYHNAADRERYKQILSNVGLSSTKPSILLKHEPKDLDVAEAAGISLHISGHTHKAQMWPFGYIAQYIYKGYAYGLKNLKGMQVFTSSGTGTWGPPMRVASDSEIVVFTFR